MLAVVLNEFEREAIEGALQEDRRQASGALVEEPHVRNPEWRLSEMGLQGLPESRGVLREFIAQLTPWAEGDDHRLIPLRFTLTWSSSFREGQAPRGGVPRALLPEGRR